MQININAEQAQRLRDLYAQKIAAEQRLEDAVQALAPGIGSCLLTEEEGTWTLTDELKEGLYAKHRDLD